VRTEAGGREPTLLLRDIRRSFGERSVLRGADLHLPPGSVAWVGGRNGAGKTTLMRIAAGLITPHGGDVSLLGRTPERERREYQRRVGWLPAGNTGLYNRLTVRQNLAYWVSVALVPRRERRATVAAALERFDLERLAGQRADRISMGERQRLRLATTFAHSPALVLMDEPHTSLDGDAMARVGAALEALIGRGGAAVWCSPSRAGVSLPADQEHRLEGGVLVPC
jgi:ABC-2 type transport system ATP-binding protein